MLFGRKSGGIQWLIVGLGNPGEKYARTRHNLGFLALDLLAEQQKLKINRIKYKALVAETEFGGERCLLMKPQTYMNLSGEAVREAAQFYKIPSDHVLVIYDDVSLPVGKLRVRPSGSAGGHNGIKNIIAHRRAAARRWWTGSSASPPRRTRSCCWRPRTGPSTPPSGSSRTTATARRP